MGREPVNAEPDKRSELVWATPVRLPPDTVGYTAAVITAVKRGTRFTLTAILRTTRDSPSWPKPQQERENTMRLAGIEENVNAAT